MKVPTCGKDRVKLARQGVLAIIKVSEESHGTDGHLGLFAGHPDLFKMQLASEEAVQTPAVAEETRQFMSFIEQKGNLSPQQIIQEWQKMQSKGDAPAAVSITGTESISDVSTASPASGSTSSVLSSPPRPRRTTTSSPPPRVSPRRAATKGNAKQAGTKATRKPRNKATAKPHDKATGPVPGTPKRATDDEEDLPPVPRHIYLPLECTKKYNCKKPHDLHLLDFFLPSPFHINQGEKMANRCSACTKILWRKDPNWSADTHVTYANDHECCYGCNHCAKNFEECKYVLCPSCHRELTLEVSDAAKEANQRTPPRASKRQKKNYR